MRGFQWTFFTAITFLGVAVCAPVARADGDDGQTCGDASLTCDTNEHCCSHTVATFSEGGVHTPSYKEGACVPKEQKCADFWCGPRHCASGIFGMPSVCCINSNAGQSIEYKCAYNELNCPGNMDQLSIRTTPS